jgi:acyl-CoA synthetase (AMP-forming)/AMP-acid ligase II
MSDMAQNNLAFTLFEMAATRPDAMAIAVPAAPGKPLPKDGPIPYQKISFKELANETNYFARGLLISGFRPGDRVVLMVPPGAEFFALCFALLLSGIIPVLIDPGIGIKRLKKCIAETEPVGFIGITKAHVARILLGWGKSSIKKKVTIGPRLFWSGGQLKNIREAGVSSASVIRFDAQPNDLAAILFTSGSTGLPKGVMYTHGNFQQQVEIILSTFKFSPGEIDLSTFPPFALFNPAVGISTVIPDMDPTRPADVDPEIIIRTVTQFGVTSMFGSPALIDRVGRYGESRKVKLPSLKRVFSAGAPVPAKALKRFSSMLNVTTEVFTPYGATEAMPVTSISSHQILREEVQQQTVSGGGICVGMPVDKLEVKVIQISDGPIPRWSKDLEVNVGEIGEIVAKGPNVTGAYFNRYEATSLAKIRDGESFWHRMGDLGYKDAVGRLWFCGRKTHRVQLADKELYSVQCESIFNRHPRVHRTALVGVNRRAVLCVEVDKGVTRQDKEQIKKELIEWAGENDLTKDIQTILFHHSFPVDIRHNAKVFREELAVWAASRL